MTKCPDCKGSGEYVGACVVEPCQRCKGLGVLDVKGKPDVPKSAMDPASTGLPNWMKDHVDSPGFGELVRANGPQWKKDRDEFINGLDLIKVGSTIHVYVHGWHKTTVVRVTTTGRGHDQKKWIYTEHGSGICRSQIRIPYCDIYCNYTQKRNVVSRWEYIKLGTPTWP